MWHMLFMFSWLLLGKLVRAMVYSYKFIPYLFAPLVGWLADVKLGRYGIIKFGSLVSFLASALVFFALITGIPTLMNLLLATSSVIVNIGATCFFAAILPFLSDQIIGASSDELTAVVQWYYWAYALGFALSDIVFESYVYKNISSEVAIIFAVPFAVIIISDCLCQQWLDRTHKVTNPIKLIIQVLNYTRKHSYPERRSAFTYIDEEQPTRIDFGKEKFGGPFTEEEVEDVKTILRLLPLVICLSFFVGTLIYIPVIVVRIDELNSHMLNSILHNSWLFPVLLIPFYQLVLYRCVCSFSSRMLRYIGASMFVTILGYVLSMSEIYGVILFKDMYSYLSCTVLAANATHPDSYVEWYWKIGPYVLFGTGKVATNVLLLEFIIAQSPDKMKGLSIGLVISCRGIVILLMHWVVLQLVFTLCRDVLSIVFLILLFIVFLILSKCYTLRERNREINIQAIVEEHYERYIDQEEEYMRQHPQHFDSLNNDS